MFSGDGPTGPTLSWDYWREPYGGAIYVEWMRLPILATVIMFYRCFLYFLLFGKPSLHASICKVCHAILGNMTGLLAPCTQAYSRVGDVTIRALVPEFSPRHWILPNILGLKITFLSAIPVVMLRVLQMSQGGINTFFLKNLSQVCLSNLL